MYRKRKPLFPRLHKCGWCKKRLTKEMPIIAKETYLGDGISVDCYFCSEKCAKAEWENRQREEEEEEDLNRRILS